MPSFVDEFGKIYIMKHRSVGLSTMFLPGIYRRLVFLTPLENLMTNQAYIERQLTNIINEEKKPCLESNFQPTTLELKTS